MAPTGWDSDYDYDNYYSFNPPLFQEFLRCLPFSRYKHSHLESGNKIVLPVSSLHRVLDMHLRFPLIFRLERGDKATHCGVLEFDGEEGSVYMPEWMMKNLEVSEGDGVCVRDAKLLQGVYMKLQPHAAAFVELSNPKAVLEMTMRGFTCLTCGDTIVIKHNDKDFYFNVVEVAPGTAISLVDTDCAVDFVAALDYEEPESGKVVEEREEEEEVTSFRPFIGTPRRLDGKAAVGGGGVVAAEEEKEREEGGGKEEGDGMFKPFTGRSRVLGRGL